jgi:hypothetical protein
MIMSILSLTYKNFIKKYNNIIPTTKNIALSNTKSLFDSENVVVVVIKRVNKPPFPNIIKKEIILRLILLFMTLSDSLVVKPVPVNAESA